MNKFLLLIVSFIFVLVGCVKAGTEDKNEIGLIKVSDIVSITIKVVGNPSVEIRETSSFGRFVQAINTAEYTLAQLDIAAPNYESLVEMKDGTSYTFSFWVIGDTTGLFTKSGQNGYYRLPDSSKKELLELFQSVSNR